MGCQLDGPPIEHQDGFNIISDGIVNGSIQVPGSGRPIVLLADRQSTGGYPKIATVISADISRIGQARIGETLRFEAVSEDEAERSAIAWNELIEAIIAMIEPAGPGSLSSEVLMSVNLIGGVVSAQAHANES
jgi:allophanate hydrolase subunit 2